MVRRMKYNFFNIKINKIANKKYSPQKLINWVKKRKLPAIKTIQYNSYSCIKLEDLWEALHNSFNLAQNHQIDTHLLEELPDKKVMSQTSFSKAELTNAINRCNNSSSTLEPDKLFQRYLKKIVKNKECINKIIDISKALTEQCLEK